MIYLDNAATSFPKPATVLKKTLSTLVAPLGNPGRSGHPLSRRAGEIVFGARESLASLLGGSPERIVFCGGATAALNMAILGLTESLNREGRIPFAVTSVFEHNSVLRPLFRLEKEGRLRLSVLCPEPNGNLTNALLYGPCPDLVVLTCRSNLTGHEFPLKNVFSTLRRRGCIVVLDAAQKLGSGECTFASTGADVICAPSHKLLFGIMGGGFLAINPASPHLPEAIFTGGSGIDSFSREMPTLPPESLEAGTLPLLAIASMKAGADFLKEFGVGEIERLEREKKRMLREGLSSLPHYLLYEPEYPSGPLLVNHKNLSSEELGLRLASHGIFARAGFHCAPLGHRFLGTEPLGGALRLSPGPFTKASEIQRTLEVLSTIP